MNKLKEGSRIEIFAEDGSYWAHVIVTGKGQLGPEVALLQHVELRDSLGGEDDVFRLRLVRSSWAVWDHVNGRVVEHGFRDKETAAEFLVQNKKKLHAEMRAGAAM